jgi:hypothetical protein
MQPMPGASVRRQVMDSKAAVQNFLAGSGTDSGGRRLAAVLAFSDDELESHHDFIQWLFPLDQASSFNPDAPVLTAYECAELGRDPAVVAGLCQGLARMLAFYGLEWQAAAIVKSAGWPARSPNWAARPTHNDLRITRILRSLALFGLQQQAGALLRFLEAMLDDMPLRPGRNSTLLYWRGALSL